MFRFTTAGESHGRALVAIVEGLPAGLPIDIDQLNHELWRRQQGYGRGGRMKIEQDQIEILSGVRHGLSLGSPLALMIENKDWANWNEVMATDAREIPAEKSRRVKRPRPGHADLAGGLKYDAHDLRNVLERASARETAARVACGAIAKQLLANFGIEASGLPGSEVHDEISYNDETKEFIRATNRAGGLEGGVTNGEEVRVRGHLKPISTLRRALRSVDIDTKQEERAAFERSDITVVPAAGVIGEAMVALVLATAMREKFGGDSLGEMKRNFEGYREQLRGY